MFPQPAGISTAVIDPSTGQLATDECSQVLTEVFIDGTVPTQVCGLHGGWATEASWPPALTREKKGKGPLRWFKKIFKRDSPEPAASPPN